MPLKFDLDIKFAQRSKITLRGQEIWSGHKLNGKAHDLEV